MSTTVSYKGNTIATVNNNTKTLKTAGKYLEADVVLTDITSGDTTINPLSVTVNGTYTAPSGTAYSPVTVNVDGGTPTPSKKWVRPSDWPDLSKMDISGGDVLYMTSYADEARGFCSFSVTCTGSYTVEVGTISGTTYTAESTQTFSSGSYCRLYYGSANGTYKVLRVTGTAIKTFAANGSKAITIDNSYGYERSQGIIDIVGKLPSCTSFKCSTYYLVNAEVGGLVLTGSVSQMFSTCSSLTSLDVSGWDTSGVTSMYQMFYYCYSLTSLDVSGLDTGSVTNMSQMFYYCNSLTSLDVSGWDTGSVTNMSSMFNNCRSLTSLDVSGWDTGSVTNMSQMFNSCYSLTSIDVSGWDFSLVTTASNAGSIFSACYSLHGSLTLPSTMTMIGSSCFSNCRSLYEWHFLATTPPTLNSTSAFDNMTDFGGKKIYVPAASLEAYKTAANWSTYASYIEGE